MEAIGLFLDYSKNRVTDEMLKLLVQLARESGQEKRRDAMYRGEKINITERRAVLDVALRAPNGQSIVVDGRNVVPDVRAVLDKMAGFADRVRSGEWKDIAASQFAMSSTSGSVAPTSVRSWHTRR